MPFQGSPGRRETPPGPLGHGEDGGADTGRSAQRGPCRILGSELERQRVPGPLGRPALRRPPCQGYDDVRGDDGDRLVVPARGTGRVQWQRVGVPRSRARRRRRVHRRSGRSGRPRPGAGRRRALRESGLPVQGAVCAGAQLPRSEGTDAGPRDPVSTRGGSCGVGREGVRARLRGPRFRGGDHPGPERSVSPRFPGIRVGCPPPPAPAFRAGRRTGGAAGRWLLRLSVELTSRSLVLGRVELHRLLLAGLPENSAHPAVTVLGVDPESGTLSIETAAGRQGTEQFDLVGGDDGAAPEPAPPGRTVRAPDMPASRHGGGSPLARSTPAE